MIWQNQNRNRRASPFTPQTKPACRAPQCAPPGCAPAKAPGGLSRRNTGMGSIRKQRLRRNAPWMSSVPWQKQPLVLRGTAEKDWHSRPPKSGGREKQPGGPNKQRSQQWGQQLGQRRLSLAVQTPGTLPLHLIIIGGIDKASARENHPHHPLRRWLRVKCGRQKLSISTRAVCGTILWPDFK